MVYYIAYEQVIIILVTTITNSVWLIQQAQRVVQLEVNPENKWNDKLSIYSFYIWA